MSIQKPRTFEEYLNLLNSPNLTLILRARLLELAMTQDSAVATTSINILLSQAGEGTVGPLADLSTEELLKAKEQVERRIRATAIAGRPTNDQDGAGPAPDA